MSNKIKNILFRADSSSTIGTGHIMRDLVLASQYSDANILFATQNLDGNINHNIVEAGYKIVLLKSNDVEEFIAVTTALKIDLIIIDSYEVDYKYEKILKERTGIKILAFDDTYEKHHCDIVLNHNISADKKRYKDLVPPNCELRCGAKYTLLREEFYQQFTKKLKIEKTNILIAMGGVDSKELNIKILDTLTHFDNLNINLITTTANKNLNKLQTYILDKNSITLHINSNEVAKLMFQSDLAILTPSVTVNEAYFMKLPFIAIKTEENQKDIYNYLQKNNFLMLESFDRKLLIKNTNLLLKILDTHLINFIQLSLKEKKMVLEWRNSDSVKKWMYNRKDIELSEHLKYIDSLKNREDRIYFLVKNSSQYIGIVDLTEIIKNESAELGIYIDPSLIGYGNLLMHKIIKYAFKELKLKRLNANVYIENMKAINLYKKFNFKIMTTLKDSNGELYSMELENENR